MKRRLPIIRGRGAGENPTSRFERLTLEPLPGADEDEAPSETLVLRDPSRSILTRNRSPDLGFEWSLNPYRGCEHGCVYCYARPTHEYLGFSAGLDFETRLFAKDRAPLLLREALAAPRWSPVPLVMSGVTDPYQPVERRLRITRGCLEVLEASAHPVAVITKSRSVVRDLDLLASLAERGAAHVTLSITTLDRRLQRTLEPRASPPEHRLEAVRALAEAGVPVSVNVAPVIPGLTEHEIPSILEAAAQAGASGAGMVLLRLPWGVKELFEEWLATHVPERAERVLNRIRETRAGRLYDSTFGSRLRGEGVLADQIQQLFQVSARRLGLERRTLMLNGEHFRRPSPDRGPEPQLSLLLDCAETPAVHDPRGGRDRSEGKGEPSRGIPPASRPPGA